MKKITVDADDGIRPQYTTPDKLKKLPAVFKKGGTTTVGNASQVSASMEFVHKVQIRLMVGYVTFYGHYHAGAGLSCCSRMRA